MNSASNAPALILQNLKPLVDALNYLETEMLSEITEIATLRTQSFMRQNDWYDIPDAEELLEFRFTPRQWEIPSESKRSKPRAVASFGITSIEPNDDHYYFWMSLFCGVNDGQAGLAFRVDARYVDLAKWKQVAASLSQEDAQTLAALGFECKADEDGGKQPYFFLPFKLDARALADAWGSGDLSSAIAPFEAALEKLPQAVQVFDRMLTPCRN